MKIKHALHQKFNICNSISAATVVPLGVVESFRFNDQPIRCKNYVQTANFKLQVLKFLVELLKNSSTCNLKFAA